METKVKLYNPDYIRLNRLPDGTFFFVRNGYWTGYIGSEDGKKVCYVEPSKTNPTTEYSHKYYLTDDDRDDIDILTEGVVAYDFDVEMVTEDLIACIREWFDENGKNSKAVLGISGGKDSTIVAALCARALGKDRVLGVLLPNGEQSDIADAYEVCQYLGIPHKCINIEKSFNAQIETLRESGVEITNQVRENIPPMVRTDIIRSICRSENGRMMNTCNLSEDYIGYFTIGGDGEGDFAPLADLTATEVIAIGHYLGLPAHLVNKTPADGLCEKSDEDNFGFTYKDLDTYIRTRVCMNEITKAMIVARHEANKFKMQPMPKFKVRGRHFPQVG